jgi:hypothetical protein
MTATVSAQQRGRNRGSLVNVGLATLDVPLWRVYFGVCDLCGVKLCEINAQRTCFVVIIDREMTDDNIATGAYTIIWSK